MSRACRVLSRAAEALVYLAGLVVLALLLTQRPEAQQIDSRTEAEWRQDRAAQVRVEDRR